MLWYLLSSKLESSYWRMCVQKMFFRMSFRNHIAAYFTFFKIPHAMNRMQIDIWWRNISSAVNRERKRFIIQRGNQKTKIVTKKKNNSSQFKLLPNNHFYKASKTKQRSCLNRFVSKLNKSSIPQNKLILNTINGRSQNSETTDNHD